MIRRFTTLGGFYLCSFAMTSIIFLCLCKSVAVIDKRGNMPKSSQLATSPFFPIVSFIDITVIVNSVLILTVEKYVLPLLKIHTMDRASFYQYLMSCELEREKKNFISCTFQYCLFFFRYEYYSLIKPDTMRMTCVQCSPALYECCPYIFCGLTITATMCI